MVFKKSPKVQVSTLVAWLCSFGYIFGIADILYILFTGTVKRLYNCFKGMHNFSILNLSDKVSIGLLVGLIIFLVFCLNFFEWTLDPCIRCKNNTLIYQCSDVIAVVGVSTTVYTIKSIESFKVKRSTILVNGDISVKEPILKEKQQTKCWIQGLYDAEDKKKVIEMLENFKNAEQ